MSWKRNLSKLAAILFVSAMNSACQLTPPNVEVCVDLGSNGAFCQFTLEDIERYIPEEIWEEMQQGRFSMDVESFGEYQKFIETACEFKKCTKKERRAQKKLLRRMGKLNEKII